MSKRTTEILSELLQAASSDARRLRQEVAHLEDELSRAKASVERASLGMAHREVAQALSARPSSKIEAIKLHRELCGSGLKEAKDAIEVFWPSNLPVS